MQIKLNKKVIILLLSYTRSESYKENAFEYTKTRFVETVLLSTHETLHIKKYTLYSESNVSYMLFDICGCFDVPGFELSMFYSIAATSKK